MGNKKEDPLYSAIDRMRAITHQHDEVKETPEAPPGPDPNSAVEIVQRAKEQAPKPPREKPAVNPSIY